MPGKAEAPAIPRADSGAGAGEDRIAARNSRQPVPEVNKPSLPEPVKPVLPARRPSAGGTGKACNGAWKHQAGVCRSGISCATALQEPGLSSAGERPGALNAPKTEPGLGRLEGKPLSEAGRALESGKAFEEPAKAPMNPLRQGEEPGRSAGNQPIGGEEPAKPARSRPRANLPRAVKSPQEPLRSRVKRPRSRAAASRPKKRSRTIAASWPGRRSRRQQVTRPSKP